MSQPLLLSKNNTTAIILVIAGALLFNAVFWQEKVALNMLLFTVFSVSALLMLYRGVLQRQAARWMLVAVVVSLLFLLLYNSALSCITCITMVLLFTAYCKYQHRSPLYAAASAAQSFQYFLPQFAAHLRAFFTHKRKAAGTLRQLRFALLPLLLVLLFFFIYLKANSAFADIASQVSNAISHWLTPVLDWVKPARLVFLLIGLFFTGGLLYKYTKATSFEAAEAAKTDELKRQRKPHRRNHLSTVQAISQIFIGHRADSAIALKYEHRAGVISLLVLNLLLLLVNVTDVAYVWAAPAYDAGFAWSEYVHEGTEMLIGSIVLAMAVVLFFFRGNLNFFKGNKYLILLAYGWLVQNAFLNSSAFLRNYYYVTSMGLTYKRIGVFVFTLLVLVGLISVFLKIRTVKTSYYLLKFNTVAALVVMVLASCFQWDVLIAQYNIRHRDTIPLDKLLLLSLSDHALPVLQQHKELFEEEYYFSSEGYYPKDRNGNPIPLLTHRIEEFLHQSQQYTWLSWNEADAQTRRQLQETTPPIAARKQE